MGELDDRHVRWAVNVPRTVERTFAFVDLAGFTALTGAHGDETALNTVRSFRERTLACLDSEDHAIKSIGDALMFAFPDPLTAVMALCRILERELTDPEHNVLPRAGAHHGTAVSEDGDFATPLPAIDPACLMRVPTEGPVSVSLRWAGELAWFCSVACASRFAAAPNDFRDRLQYG